VHFIGAFMFSSSQFVRRARKRAAGSLYHGHVKETIPGRQASCSNLPAFVCSTNPPTAS